MPIGAVHVNEGHNNYSQIGKETSQGSDKRKVSVRPASRVNARLKARRTVCGRDGDQTERVGWHC